MASSKSFLLQECANVRDVLDETLRYKYGGDGSKDFYDECLIRLESTKRGVEQAPDEDHDQLTAFSFQIRNLTRLIARIERSSIGEYSWPFVEELKELAAPICAEATLNDDSTPPKIHVLSEGGLVYAIDPEQNRPSASRRKILTIVLPRTLKHFVLLHAILGHEIGHAIWAHAKHQSRLKQIRDTFLSKTGSVLETPAATGARIFRSDAPFIARQQLIRSAAREADFFTTCDWEAWVEELLCDLIGLVTFGPSYVAAACHLLLALDPTGLRYGPDHPPIAWRLNMLLEGANVLGFDSIDTGDQATANAVQGFWAELKTKRHSDAWCDVIDRASLAGALNEISSFLNAYPPAVYPFQVGAVLPSLLQDLKQHIPPAGCSIGEDNTPQLPKVDFRHILYAGWIHGHCESIDTKILNRLCEHAIMQQRALKTFAEAPA